MDGGVGSSNQRSPPSPSSSQPQQQQQQHQYQHNSHGSRGHKTRRSTGFLLDVPHAEPSLSGISRSGSSKLSRTSQDDYSIGTGSGTVNHTKSTDTQPTSITSSSPSHGNTAESRLLSLFAPQPDDPDPAVVASAALKLREARLGQSSSLAGPNRSNTTKTKPKGDSDRTRGRISPVRSFLMHGGETRSLSAALGLNFLENADKNANYATALGLPSSPNSDALPPIPVSEATRSRVQKCREYFELYSAYNDLSTIGSGSSRHNPLEAIRNRKARYKERVQLDLAPWKDLEQVKDWVNQTLNQPGYDGRQGRPTLPPPPIPNNPHVAEGPRRRPKMDWIISPEELLADFYAAKTRPLADFKCEYGRPEVAGPASSVDKRNRLGEEPKALRHNAYDAALGDKDDEAKPHRDHHGFRHNPFSRAHKDGYSSSDEDGMFSSGDESDKRLAALRKMKSKVSPPGRKRHHFRRRPTRADSHDSQGLDSDAQFADDAKWNSYGAATSGPPEHREPDSSDSDADGYHSEADYADNTIQIRRPQGGRPSFDFADVVVPSIAINLDPPKPREKTRKEEKKERKEEKKEMKEEKERESPAKSKVKPSPLRIAPKTSMEDDEVSRGRGAGSRKPSFGQDSNGEDVTALAAMRNKGASAAMSKILRRKGSPSKNRSQNDLITDDDTQHEKESRIKSPARKAKHMVDSRVEKIKQEVAKVEGYIKGKDGEKSGHHDSSAPSSYPSSAVSGSEDERGEKWRENLSFSITKRRPKLMQTQTAPSLVPQARRPLPPIPTERDPLVIPGNKARGIPDIRPERPIMVFPQVQKHYSRVQQVAGEARAERTRGLERAQSMEDIGRRHRRGEPLREVLEADKRLNEILKTPPRRGGTFHPPKDIIAPTANQLELDQRWDTRFGHAHNGSIHALAFGASVLPTTPGPLSTRKDMARARVLLLSTGIVARELARRRSHQIHLPQGSARDDSPDDAHPPRASNPTSPSHSSSFSPQHSLSLSSSPTSSLDDDVDAIPNDASVLAHTALPIALGTAHTRSLNLTLPHLASQHQALCALLPPLHNRCAALTTELETVLTPLERETTDAADALLTSLLTTHAKALKMLDEELESFVKKRRKRGVRWGKRVGFLVLEWAVVGVMWWVWVVVVGIRAVRGVVRGGWRVVAWVLWI